MSLILVVRSKISQDNLNENIQKQAEEAEKQQVVLEETVKERTSELEEKSTALEGVSNQLAKYIPPRSMMRCLQESMTRRLKHKEES